MPYEASDRPSVDGRTGTASSLSPTHKGSTFYHVRLSIGRSGLFAPPTDGYDASDLSRGPFLSE